MLQRGGREDYRGEGRGRSIPSRPPPPPNPLLTAAGGKAREEGREEEREGRERERERRGESPCARVSRVRARVDCTTASPFAVPAGGHALMERPRKPDSTPLGFLALIQM